ncbi:MAG: hypothetical protein NUK62_05585 [Tenericutes bacterium]|nr:hypothetical protein [Mycoplasmatota bacterium]
MKNKLYLSIIILIVFAFSLILGFVLDGMENMAITSGTPTIIYWISKGIALGLLLIVALYVVFRKQDVGNIYILLYMTLALQLLPFIERLLLRGDSPRIIWSLIVLFIVTVGYLSVIFGLDILNDKIQKVEESLKGKSIPVVDEDLYNDENGNFVSAKKKKVD